MFDQLRTLTIQMVRIRPDGIEVVEGIRYVPLKPVKAAQGDRGHKVNCMILDHVARTHRYSGEMRCPECRAGTICYLVQRDRRTIVECSTPGCVKWDLRVPL